MLSTKLVWLQIITRSMVLKFFSQRKHLARLVFGWVAVRNSPQRGHRKRKNPSENLQGIINCLSINQSIGMKFRNSYSCRPENLFFILSPPSIITFFKGAPTVASARKSGNHSARLSTKLTPGCGPGVIGDGGFSTPRPSGC